MSYPTTTFVNLNIFNDTNKNMLCRREFDFPGGILRPNSRGVNVICNRAEYSVSNVAMYYNNEDIIYTIRQAGNPNNILNTYTLKKGFYNSIREMLAEINLNIATVGEYRLNGDKIEYKSVTPDTETPTRFLFLPYRLYYLLEGFDYDVYTAPDGEKQYIIYEKGTAWRTQEYSTTSRFYNRKSIRVCCYNLYAKTHIENSNLKGYDHTALLTDQVLLEGRDKLIYIPTQYRKITLNNINELSRFTIAVEVEYANGAIFPLELAPGTYFSALLSFEE